MPELGAQVQAQLVAARITDVSVAAYALGENCMDANNQVNHFSPMTANFDLTLSVPDLKDRVTIGNRLATVFMILINQYPRPSSPPGIPNWQIKVVVKQGNQSIASPTIFPDQIAQWVKQGLRGAALLDALEGKP